MAETWNNILYDLKLPVSWLIPAVLISIFVGAVCQIGNRARRFRTCSGKIYLLYAIFFAYVRILIQMTIFSRAPGSRQGISYILLETWGNSAKAHAFFIENIMMFIPLGILLPVIFRKMRKMSWCVGMGFVCSCGIEFVQLMTQRGYCQLDDVVTNTLGGLIGWVIWKGFSKSKMYHRK